MMKLEITYKSGDVEVLNFATFDKAYDCFKRHLNVSVVEMYIRDGLRLLAGYYQPFNRFSDYD